jgi:hypothetical protein
MTCGAGACTVECSGAQPGLVQTCGSSCDCSGTDGC